MCELKQLVAARAPGASFAVPSRLKFLNLLELDTDIIPDREAAAAEATCSTSIGWRYMFMSIRRCLPLVKAAAATEGLLTTPLYNLKLHVAAIKECKSLNVE